MKNTSVLYGTSARQKIKSNIDENIIRNTP